MTDETMVPVGPGVDFEDTDIATTAVPDGDERPPLGLTVEQLEALLFVAERPLTRREIASLAGVLSANMVFEQVERLADIGD